jgi:hypothetical protein
MLVPAIENFWKILNSDPNPINMAEFDRNLAVIIGINEYQEQLGIKTLKAARPDAEKLAEILREQGYAVDLGSISVRR